MKLAVAPLAVALAALPMALDLEGGSAALHIKLSAAAAKDGGGNSGPGGGDDGGDDDGGGNSGHGGGGGDDDRGDRRDRDSEHRSGPHGERIERRGGKIEVVYPDGYKETIEAGRFEMKDPRGRTVIERAATAEDRARLEALFR